MKKALVFVILSVVLISCCGCTANDSSDDVSDGGNNIPQLEIEEIVKNMEEIEPEYEADISQQLDSEDTEEVSGNDKNEEIDIEIKGYSIPLEEKVELDVSAAELFLNSYLEELKGENIVEEKRLTDFKINEIVALEKVGSEQEFFMGYDVKPAFENYLNLCGVTQDDGWVIGIAVFVVLEIDDNHLVANQFGTDSYFGFMGEVENGEEDIQPSQYLQVNARALNVREDSSVDSDIMGMIFEQNIYDIYEERTEDDGVWYRIKNSRGDTGWVAGWHCDLVDKSVLVNIQSVANDILVEDEISLENLESTLVENQNNNEDALYNSYYYQADRLQFYYNVKENGVVDIEWFDYTGATRINSISVGMTFEEVKNLYGYCKIQQGWYEQNYW